MWEPELNYCQSNYKPETGEDGQVQTPGLLALLHFQEWPLQQQITLWCRDGVCNWGSCLAADALVPQKGAQVDKTLSSSTQAALGPYKPPGPGSGGGGRQRKSEDREHPSSTDLIAQQHCHRPAQRSSNHHISWSRVGWGGDQNSQIRAQGLLNIGAA